MLLHFGEVSLLCATLFVLSVVRSDPDKYCRRIPSETKAIKTTGDNGFKITIIGRPPPGRYTPGKTYTIMINGTYRTQKFLGFMMVAVRMNAKDENIPLGTFQHVDEHSTKLYADCPNIITDKIPGSIRTKYTYGNGRKSGESMLWTAPASGSGCVEFRAMVLEYNDIWYKDDGALTKVFCEEGSGKDQATSGSVKPPNKKCCACGTAKYSVTFTGTWTRQRHPKNYPTGSSAYLLHWSNIVGASHDKSYKIWQYGHYASEAVRKVCEFGYVRDMEKELKSSHNAINSIITMRGLWGPKKKKVPTATLR